MGKSRSTRTSRIHWITLLNYAEEHKEIITNKFLSPFMGKTHLHDSWKKLTDQLNSLGEGEKKLEEWKKSLADFKSKTKKKAAEIKRNQSSTDGGSELTYKLTDIEERLLSLMEDGAVYGQVETVLKASENNSNPQIDIRLKQEMEEEDEEEIILEYLEEDPLGNHSSTPQSMRKRADTESLVDETRDSSSPQMKKQKIEAEEIHKETLNCLRNINGTLVNLNYNLSKIADALTILAEKS